MVSFILSLLSSVVYFYPFLCFSLLMLVSVPPLFSPSCSPCRFICKWSWAWSWVAFLCRVHSAFATALSLNNTTSTGTYFYSSSADYLVSSSPVSFTLSVLYLFPSFINVKGRWFWYTVSLHSCPLPYIPGSSISSPVNASFVSSISSSHPLTLIFGS